LSTLQIAAQWFSRRAIGDGITLLWEPHVSPLLRCNIWHVRGRNCDLLIDTGLGVASLKAAASDLFDKSLTAVATHTHMDHMGGMHEFATRYVHAAEAQAMYDGPLLDEIPGADIAVYVATMRRLRDLPVDVVHAGHDPSFGRARLIEIVEAYLRKRVPR
jgi:glyoxylase-like metal-dependent hydrolase (beta-lactamase superfamily II)